MAAALSSKSLAGTSSGLSARTRSSARPRASVRVAAAAGRPTWLPNLDPPAWLDGSLPGDFGFDPLSLGSNPERLKWCVSLDQHP